MKVSLTSNDAVNQLDECIKKAKTMSPEDQVDIVLPKGQKIECSAEILSALDQSRVSE